MHCYFNINIHIERGGIRTHGDLRLTRFPSVPIRPLSHPSQVANRVIMRLWKVIADHSMLTQRYRVSTLPSSEVAVGSCATDARESGQGRKTAAFIGNVRVPQTTWPSLQSADAFYQLWCAKFFCNCFESLGWTVPFPVGNVSNRNRCNEGC